MYATCVSGGVLYEAALYGYLWSASKMTKASANLPSLKAPDVRLRCHN